jgi:amino acid transporter
MITFVNCVNVRLASRIQIVFTVAKIASMGLIIVGGIVQVAKGK